MMRHLILRLDAPLMSFGAEMVDAYGVVRDFPARSAITGLLANALGWERYQTEWHDRLQSRLVMGAARLQEGMRVRDFQTAQLKANDRGWTTRGEAEGRAGGAGTYESPYIRYRDADANAQVLVALRLDPADEAPTIDELAAALDAPERPLFIGRKPFLPSCRIHAGIVDADTIVGALTIALAGQGARAQWPRGEGPEEHTRIVEFTDERRWQAGVHMGLMRVVEGRIPAATEA
jgi:CRISPR system Cascade subunit CasD